MSDPVTAAAAVSAGSSIFGGIAGNAAARSDARAAEYRAKALATVAHQKSAKHRATLNEALSSISALSGQRNLSGRGATAMAVRRANRSASAANENSDVLETRYGIVNERTRARNARARGMATLVQGFAKAGSTALNAAA